VSSRGRPRIAWCTVSAELRTLRVSPAPWFVVLAAIPVPLTIWRGGVDLRGATLGAMLVGAAATALAVEEVGGPAAGPAPVWAGWRRAIRLVALGVVVASTAAAAVALAVRSGLPVDVARDALWPALAVAAGAVALALVLPGEGNGVQGAVLALLAAATSTMLANRWPQMPSLVDLPGRWPLVALVGAGVAAHAWADTGTGPRRRLFRPGALR
jgi:hypothetical protein